MDEEQTLIELGRLFALYPGAAVDFVRRMPGAIRFLLRIPEPESLARLARCAAGANVPLHVLIRGPGRLDAPYANPADLRYEFEIPRAGAGSEPPTGLECLGNFLVWDLAAYGALDRDAASRLLAIWNGVEI
jgi:hypothetical protein